MIDSEKDRELSRASQKISLVIGIDAHQVKENLEYICRIYGELNSASKLTSKLMQELREASVFHGEISDWNRDSVNPCDPLNIQWRFDFFIDDSRIAAAESLRTIARALYWVSDRVDAASIAVLPGVASGR